MGSHYRTHLLQLHSACFNAHPDITPLDEFVLPLLSDAEKHTVTVFSLDNVRTLPLVDKHDLACETWCNASELEGMLLHSEVLDRMIERLFAKRSREEEEASMEHFEESDAEVLGEDGGIDSD